MNKEGPLAHLATRRKAMPNLCFLNFGPRTRPTAVSERELREALDLAGTTTGKGKAKLRTNQRPLEVPPTRIHQ